MSELYIRGGRRLVGDVTINGAKNAAVAILPAALLVDGISEIDNLPYIDDVMKLKRDMEDLPMFLWVGGVISAAVTS